MTRIAGSWIAGLLLLIIPQSAIAQHRATEPTASNRKTITAFADLFYRQKKVRVAFERYVAVDYIQHNPSFPDGRDGPIPGLEKLFGPAAVLDVKRIVVDGDYAVLHILARLNPAERGLAVVDIYRLSGGKIVEHWDVVQPIPAQSANPHPMF